MRAAIRIGPPADTADLGRAISLLGARCDTARLAGRTRTPRTGHHVLIATDEGGEPLGMIVGVETAGIELFVYELQLADLPTTADDELHDAGEVGVALCTALADAARESGCEAMWVLADPCNEAAARIFRASGAHGDCISLMLEWQLR